MSIQNRDNDFLEPLVGGAIGSVWEVNGAGAEEIPDFVPTHHELVQLLKFWVHQALDIEFFWFLYESVGSDDTRLQSFAHRRINRIAECVGDALADEAINEATDQFAKSRDPEDWRVFRNGTRQEKQAYRARVMAEEKSGRAAERNENGADT